MRIMQLTSLKKMYGSGRDDNGVAVPYITVQRQKKQIGVGVGDEYIVDGKSKVVGNKFLPLHFLYKRMDYNYSKVELDNSFIKQGFVKIFTTHFDHNLKDAGFFICAFIYQ